MSRSYVRAPRTPRDRDDDARSRAKQWALNYTIYILIYIRNSRAWCIKFARRGDGAKSSKCRSRRIGDSKGQVWSDGVDFHGAIRDADSSDKRRMLAREEEEEEEGELPAGMIVFVCVKMLCESARGE